MHEKREIDFAGKVFVVTFAIIAGLAVLFFLVKPYLGLQEQNTISVQGSGEVFVVPDKASIYLSAEVKDKESSFVETQIKEKMNKITAAIKELGIKEEDIETTGYYIDINREWVNNTYLENGFIGRQTLKVSVTDFKKIGSIINVATKNGATSIYNVDFELTKNLEEQKKAEVIKEATKNAKGKAEALTESLGKKVGAIVRVDIQDSPFYYPLRYDTMAAVEKAVAGSAPDQGEGSSGTIITPTKIQVSSSVNIVYKIK